MATTLPKVMSESTCGFTGLPKILYSAPAIVFLTMFLREKSASYMLWMGFRAWSKNGWSDK